MALFYSPVLTKRPKPKTMSKTAFQKHLREIRKSIKEIETYDKALADAFKDAVSHLSKLEK